MYRSKAILTTYHTRTTQLFISGQHDHKNLRQGPALVHSPRRTPRLWPYDGTGFFPSLVHSSHNTSSATAILLPSAANNACLKVMSRSGCTTVRKTAFHCRCLASAARHAIRPVSPLQHLIFKRPPWPARLSASRRGQTSTTLMALRSRIANGHAAPPRSVIKFIILRFLKSERLGKSKNGRVSCHFHVNEPSLPIPPLADRRGVTFPDIATVPGRVDNNGYPADSDTIIAMPLKTSIVCSLACVDRRKNAPPYPLLPVLSLLCQTCSFVPQ